MVGWQGYKSVIGLQNQLFLKTVYSKLNNTSCKCSKRHKEGCQDSLPWLGSLCVKEERQSMGLHVFLCVTGSSLSWTKSDGFLARVNTSHFREPLLSEDTPVLARSTNTQCWDLLLDPLDILGSLLVLFSTSPVFLLFSSLISGLHLTAVPAFGMALPGVKQAWNAGRDNTILCWAVKEQGMTADCQWKCCASLCFQVLGRSSPWKEDPAGKVWLEQFL